MTGPSGSAAGRRALRDHRLPQIVGQLLGGDEDRVTTEDVHRDARPACERMAHSHGEDARLSDQDRTGTEIRFLHRQHQQQQIDLVLTQQP